MKQDTKRFVVPPGLTNEGQIREALQLIAYINEQSGNPSDVVLFIPTKSQLDGTIIDATLGERVCKALKKGVSLSVDPSSPAKRNGRLRTICQPR